MNKTSARNVSQRQLTLEGVSPQSVSLVKLHIDPLIKNLYAIHTFHLYHLKFHHSCK